MTNVDATLPPSVHACELAAAGLFPSDAGLFIESSPVLEDCAPLLDLEVELAHALVLALATLPEDARLPFAERFFAGRRRSAAFVPLPGPRDRLAAAAAIALLVVDLTDRDELRSARVVDVLTAAAQGDDLSLTPATAAAEIRAAVARARLDAGVGDPFAARSAATTAVLEVLDPASGEVALQEVLLRATWAALRSRQPERVLEFLLAADEAFEAAANA